MAKRVYKQIELTTAQKIERAEAGLFNVRQRLADAERHLSSAQERGLADDVCTAKGWATISEIAADVAFWQNEVALNEANLAALRAAA